jgi:hypothetical protein
MRKIVQLEFDFTPKPDAARRTRLAVPLAARIVARRHHLDETLALAICRANGIGGKGAL